MTNRTIMLVDDEPQILTAMREILARAGFDVVTAASGVEAVAKMSERQLSFDLVITDLKMPRFSGLDLIRQIRQNQPLTRVVLITAFGTVETAVQAMKMGAFDYILKPFNAEVLLDIVNKALGGAREIQGKAIITQSDKMFHLLKTASQAARTGATILIEAESGTGKELLARFIHDSSARKDSPFIAVNCAALPENLLESELMGYEKGSFTGATAEKPGKFELADGGTILLDEIGEMAPLLQAKILRVLQEKEVDRIGGVRPVPVNLRVIATTNCNLAEMVEESKFRRDLYFRLNVIPLRIPPLRERLEDIRLLVEHFITKYSGEERPEGDFCIPEQDWEKLQRYPWPGNVRELENIVHRAVVLATNNHLDLTGELPLAQGAAPAELSLSGGMSLQEMERRLILSTLEQTGGNRTQAAKLLQISVRTLRNKLKEMEPAAIAP